MLAPDFTLQTDTGDSLTLSDLRGKPVVLYFYPKDDTPGCTTQACEFRDAFPKFNSQGAVILGVSPDDVDSHRRFKEKFSLPFTLLSDVDHEVAESYGVWKEKSMFGNRYWGVDRTTFVIGPDGAVAKEFRQVKPEGHAEEVRAVLEELGRR